jgi:hypothetical protein
MNEDKEDKIEQANQEHWTNGQPQKVTEEILGGQWGFLGTDFNCTLCGKKFKLDDTFRFVYCMPNTPNFIICADCDHDNVREEFIKKYHEASIFLNRAGGGR